MADDVAEPSERSPTPRLADILAGLRAALPELRRHGVRSLGVFGSYVRGDNEAASDVDLLVDFDHTPDLFELVRLEDHLSNLLGLRADLVMSSGLRPAIGRRIRREVIPV